jgi:predicted lipoprotein
VKLWSRKQVADYLGVTLAYVDMIRHKLPEPVYIGRLPRWVPEEVQRTVLAWRKG